MYVLKGRDVIDDRERLQCKALIKLVVNAMSVAL